jgi:hypothetical protein
VSIYATWLTIQHPNDWLAEMQGRGIEAGLIGDASEECELGSPWVYQGSQILPAETDPRGGLVMVSGIPNHITRDGRDDGHEGLHDWLRLDVAERRTSESWQNSACVLLNRPQVEALSQTLSEWLTRSSEVEA